MRSISLVKKILSTAVVAAAFGAVSAPAFAADYVNFTIDENSVPGTSPNGNSALVADRLNGLYTETFTPIFNTPTSGTFTTVAVFNISAYYENDVLVPGVLGCSLSPCYNLYADFQSTGTFNIVGTEVTFTGLTAAVQLYLDPDQVLGTANTLLASSSTLIAGSGSINTALNNGDFEIIFGSLDLETAGESFFIEPRPFHVVVDVNGNFTENPLEGGPVSGSANAFFLPAVVPEPGSLALVGAALLGLAVARRRRA